MPSVLMVLGPASDACRTEPSALSLQAEPEAKEHSEWVRLKACIGEQLMADVRPASSTDRPAL